MKKPLRRIARIVLKYLSVLVLKKHRPDVIVVTGDGQTAIVREAIYTVLHERFPTRRNLEAPETEFSVPLTVFGVQHYPAGYLAWLKVLTKTILQLLKLKPHFHILVLELNPNLGEVADYWFEITKPNIVVQCGRIKFETQALKAAERFFCEESKNGYLAPHFLVAEKVGLRYKISRRDLKASLQKFSLPQARIRLLTGKKGRIIIDSSYYYFPPPLKSVLEIINILPGKKIFFTNDSTEQKIVKEELPEVKLIETLEPRKVDEAQVVIIRGQKNKTLRLLKMLVKAEFLV